ncbi:hypothetical protein LLG46_12985 [bacterium]|nr:hypothetical protein [bacterium]
MYTRLCLLLIGLLFVCLPVTAATYTQSFTDLWNVGNGISIVSCSGTHFANTDILDMFGANGSYYVPERGNTLFRDGQPQNYRHFIEWQMPGSVTVGRIALWAAHDGGSCGRSFNRFTLEAWNSAAGGYVTVYDTQVGLPYTWVEGNEGLVVNKTFDTPFTSSLFRASFYQATTIPYASGPRIYELDAFTAPPSVPEWGSLALALLGLVPAARFARRKK